MKTQTITLRLERGRADALLAFLATLDFVEVGYPEAAFVPGRFGEGEKPSDMAPVWRLDERTLESIRQKAWQRK